MTIYCEKAKAYHREYQLQLRNDPTKRAQALLQDARRDDRKKGRENDLDLAFVAATISGECAYCGDDDCKKTLDRIDNALGHLQSNVVVSCIRCNLVRANMPYAAWLELRDGMRSARVKGLFGDWHGKFQRK